ncbi:MAG: hypothetical protein ACHQAZ_02760 [Gammaproteobacteria bacterium]
MNTKSILTIIVTVLMAASATPSLATGTNIEQMPAKLETRYALSAVPQGLRDKASVYLLDPKVGYQLSRQGTSGVACIVERTQWELADFRDDIYFPVCYDAAGAATYLKVIMDAAALRAKGMGAAALKAEVERRYKDKTYGVPARAGLSYMVGPMMRTIGPPDLKVHTMAMPHLMFYAPNVTDAEIGAAPDLAEPSSLLYPFISRQGNGETSYMIQLIGETEKARILADEKALLADLCAYRDVLCLMDMKH